MCCQAKTKIPTGCCGVREETLKQLQWPQQKEFQAPKEEAGAAVLETMSGQVETAIDLVGRCKPGAARASSESSIQPYNKKQKAVADHFKGLALQKQVQ